MSNLSPRAIALRLAHGPGPIDWERIANLVHAPSAAPGVVAAATRIRNYIEFKQMQKSGYSFGMYDDWQRELRLSDLRAVADVLLDARAPRVVFRESDCLSGSAVPDADGF